MASAVTSSDIANTVKLPNYQNNQRRTIEDTQGSEISFETVLSSVLPELDLDNKILQTDVKLTGSRLETNSGKKNNNEASNKAKTSTPAHTTVKEKVEASKQQARADSTLPPETTDLETPQIIVVSAVAKTKTDESQTVNEDLSFSSIEEVIPVEEKVVEEETVADDVEPQLLITTQPGTKTGSTTIDRSTPIQEDTFATEKGQIHLSDSSLTLRDNAPADAIVTDPTIIHALSRTVQPTVIAHVEILNQPVTPMPLLASAVPLQIETLSSDDAQLHPNLAVTAIEGEKSSSRGNGGAEFTHDHSGSFAGNQSSSETATTRLEKTTESLSHTSTQQAEKVQALQQVMQDFRSQLSKITGRPVNLKISVRNEKLGNVDVRIDFNERDKTVSAVFHADSDEMVQMLTQQRSEIEDILKGTKLNPTLQFYKTKEI